MAAADLDKTLPLLWPLVDEAGSHDILGMFLQMAERISV